MTIPSSVTSIGNSAFSECSGLTSVTIPSSVTSIRESVFYGCSGLTSVTIPSSVTYIGKSAFSGCSGLTSVYVSWPFPIQADNVFYYADVSKCTLFVPKGTRQDYFLADGWGDFGKIIEYEPTGIDNVNITTGAKEVSRYTVGGQRLASPAKGLNIVKYSDGTTRKIMVP